MRTSTFVQTVQCDGQSIQTVVPLSKSRFYGPQERLSLVQWMSFQPLLSQHSMEPLRSKTNGLERMSTCSCSSIRIAMEIQIQRLGQRIQVPSLGISQKIPICFMGRLIQVITMIFFQERAMLKHGLILVKKSSGMVEYTTSIWMRATYKVDLVR